MLEKSLNEFISIRTISNIYLFDKEGIVISSFNDQDLNNFKKPEKSIIKILDNRKKTIEQGYGIDWATSESLAFGSLLYLLIVMIIAKRFFLIFLVVMFAVKLLIVFHLVELLMDQAYTLRPLLVYTKVRGGLS